MTVTQSDGGNVDVHRDSAFNVVNGGHAGPDASGPGRRGLSPSSADGPPFGGPSSV